MKIFLMWSYMKSTAVVVFTRDLRVHDNPALVAASQQNKWVAPLFVLDPKLINGPQSSANRSIFLYESLAGLNESLEHLGTRLIISQGVWADEVMKFTAAVEATEIHMAMDYSRYAKERLRLLEITCQDNKVKLFLHDSHSVVPPGKIQPGGGNEYKIFTPYYKKWLAEPWRPVLEVPTLAPPSQLNIIKSEISNLDFQSNVEFKGGESIGRSRMEYWFKHAVQKYEETRDDLSTPATSLLSPYLHFGSLSLLELATKAKTNGSDAYLRQLCWRDFYLQILAEHPDSGSSDYRDRGDNWTINSDYLEAWKTGTTGYPIVDAGMRQLLAEGFMHNRTRMVTASFLTKDLYLDWRLGATHFRNWLIDGDLASNQLGWQWVAGTGTDTNPNRIFSPQRQSERFDPAGEYIRKYVHELKTTPTDLIHNPPSKWRTQIGYPEPIVNHKIMVERYKKNKLRNKQE